MFTDSNTLFVVFGSIWLTWVFILGKPSREKSAVFVGPLQRVRPRNGILALVLVVLVVLVLVLVLPLRSEFIGEL